jgi:predicted dehydrogenase
VTPLRVGALGAAHITPHALLEPALASNGRIAVTAIAARDPERARAFAHEHGIAAVAADYGELVARDDVDAVYIALPASEHAQWIGAAIAAGKHVLCEKPLTTMTADTAAAVALAQHHGRVLCEGYHYRFHPLMERALDVVRGGELGAIQHIDAQHLNNVPASWPVYWSAELGGGSTLHTGCYPVHCIRTLLGEEATVVAAEADWRDGVDAAHRAELRFPSGATARVTSSMCHDGPATNEVTVHAERGQMRIHNFIVPHYGVAFASMRAFVEVTLSGASPTRYDFDLPATYVRQLDEFASACAAGSPLPTGGDDAVQQALLLDAMLAAAKFI